MKRFIYLYIWIGLCFNLSTLLFSALISLSSFFFFYHLSCVIKAEILFDWKWLPLSTVKILKDETNRVNCFLKTKQKKLANQIISKYNISWTVIVHCLYLIWINRMLNYFWNNLFFFASCSIHFSFHFQFYLLWFIIIYFSWRAHTVCGSTHSSNGSVWLQ